MEHRIVRSGWDGRSQPILEAVQPCGCRWTTDLRCRLHTCTACLSAALRRDYRGQCMEEDDESERMHRDHPYADF